MRAMRRLDVADKHRARQTRSRQTRVRLSGMQKHRDAVVKYREGSVMDAEQRDSPFVASVLSKSCPKCGAEAQLMRTEKFPDFKCDVHIYECGKCGHKNEVIART